MKKNTKSTIALAAAVLLLSGTLASAAQRVDVGQSTKSNVTGSLTKTKVRVAAGAVDDINQDDPQGGGQSTPPCKQEAQALESFIEPLICMISSVTGTSICLRDDMFGDDADGGPKCQ